jgi:hypothetical protein
VKSTYQTSVTTAINVSLWPMMNRAVSNDRRHSGATATSSTGLPVPHMNPASFKPEELDAVVVNYKILQWNPKLLSQVSAVI